MNLGRCYLMFVKRLTAADPITKQELKENMT